MKGMVKRFCDGILAFVLVLTLVSAISSVTVEADEILESSSFESPGNTSDYLSYELAEGDYIVNNTGQVGYEIEKEEFSLIKADGKINEKINESVTKIVNDSKKIKEEDVPLGAAEDTCYIHWIVLILSILVVGYTVIRIAVGNKQEESVTEEL